MGAKCDRCGNFNEEYRKEKEYPLYDEHSIQVYLNDMYYYCYAPLDEYYDWRCR